MPVLNYAKETTSTSGTGTYTLDGAVSPFSSFVARASADIGGSSPWSTVFYVCTDNSTNWEFGDGVLTDAASDTLTRATIHASSNAGAAVNWPDTSAKDIYSWPPGSQMIGVVKQQQRDFTTTNTSTATSIPYDDTTPQNTEGASTGLSVSITPDDSANFLMYEFYCPLASYASSPMTFAVFQNTTCVQTHTLSTTPSSVHIMGYVVSGGTSAQTWTVRFGPSGGGTVYVLSDVGTTKFSTADRMVLTVTEFVN
jgi:hypothetical protein